MKIRVFLILVFILICAFSPAIYAEETESIERTLEGIEGMVADSIGTIFLENRHWMHIAE